MARTSVSRSPLGLASDLGPAALVVLAWTLVWALALVDVVAPLGRWQSLDRTPAAVTQRA
jgi:hypothetical protein